ncbi:MAG: hypothetical protein M1817_005911 [Caeruleum heppii]|nr:MAG: hypothetical protein M1817_005911 [Caeruleum heppii]
MLPKIRLSPLYGNFTGPPTNGNLTVGIIGAGTAGLYAAILLESLGIDYEILEADSRPGGRILTHYFNETAWRSSQPGEPDYYDYVDIGAMRIPGMPYMDRIIGTQNNSLVSFVNAKVRGRDRLRMIPYIFETPNDFRLYNDVLRRYSDPATGDPFGVGDSKGGNIPNAFAALSPNVVWDGVVDEFVNAMNANFDDGFRKLMDFDSLSVREYFTKKNFTDAEIDWLETTQDATGHYDMALSETMLEDWIFGAAPKDAWITIEGGMSRLVNGMVESIKGNVQYAQRVKKISHGPLGGLNVSTAQSTRAYSHVINTVPLGVMQQMDMTDLDLEYAKKFAIRKLAYDPATKIGMRFRTRWWEGLSPPLKGGQSLSDLPIRLCVYPSYGINVTGAPGSMIVSYTWGQDALRLGSSFNNLEARTELVDVVLRNLAAMNNVTFAFLKDQYLEMVPWSWYDSEFALGAFALFAPAQFSTTLPAMMAPAAHGRLHFAGEALSTGNGWIIGALNSAYRAVAEVLALEQRGDLLRKLIDTWGETDEIDMGWYDERQAVAPVAAASVETS